MGAGPLTALSRQDVDLALSRSTRQVLQQNWRVLAGISTTQFTVALRNPAAVVPNVLPSAAANYVGARLEFVGGALGGVSPVPSTQTPGLTTPTSAYGRVEAIVASVVSSTSSSSLVTTVTLEDALPAEPSNEPFIVYAPTTRVVEVPGGVADGTTVASSQALFSPAYTVPANGTVLLGIALENGAQASAIQVSRDDGTSWYALLRGQALPAGQEYDVAVPVYAGDQWTVSCVDATTVGILRAMYQPDL